MLKSKLLAGALTLSSFLNQSEATPVVCQPNIIVDAKEPDKICSLVKARIDNQLKHIKQFTSKYSLSNIKPVVVQHFQTKQDLTSKFKEHSRGVMIPTKNLNRILSCSNLQVDPSITIKNLLIDYIRIFQINHNLFHEVTHHVFYSVSEDFQQTEKWIKANGFTKESLVEGLAEMYAWSKPANIEGVSNTNQAVIASLYKFPINYDMLLHYSGKTCPDIHTIFFDESLEENDFHNYFCSSLYLRFLESKHPNIFNKILKNLVKPDFSIVYSFEYFFNNPKIKTEALNYINKMLMINDVLKYTLFAEQIEVYKMWLKY